MWYPWGGGVHEVKIYFHNNPKTLSLTHYVDIHIDGAEAVVGKTAPTLTQIKAVAMCF